MCTVHEWRLVEVEFEDRQTITTYRCVDCRQEKHEG